MSIEITDENFTTEVLQNDKPAILDFWAPNCGPCKMISPFIDSLAEEFKEEVLVGKVNIEDNSGLALKYSVRSIPTILFLKDGEIVEKHIGATSKTKLEKKLIQNLL